MPDAVVVKRVLVIVAHPDDAEFWAGGTISGWTETGVEVSYLVLTDGDAGGFEERIERSEIPGIRRAEQRRAAAGLGVHDVSFLGFPEGSLLEQRRAVHMEIVRAIRRVRPGRIVTWSPEWNWVRFRSCHPDHLATGTLVLHAIYPDAGNRFALPALRDEGLEPWTVGEIWLLNSPHPNHWVDITAIFQHKLAAVRAHASQSAHYQDLERHLRDRAEAVAASTGWTDGRLAEAFQIVVNG
ncbi:MAG TPA: PIG-L deacetylase family protein [Micromonosporaceae bacterium]